MTISYNIPTGTISIDITPEEFITLTDAARTKIATDFVELIHAIKKELEKKI